MTFSWTTTFTLRTFLATSLLLVLIVKLCQVQSHSATRVGTNILANAHQSLTSFVEHVLQTDHDTLEIRLTALLNVVAHFSEIDCVDNAQIRVRSMIASIKLSSSPLTYCYQERRRLRPSQRMALDDTSEWQKEEQEQQLSFHHH